MILPLAYLGDSVLRKKGAPIKQFDDNLRQFIKDMEETMIAKNGWGLAAPQVHHSLALFIICIPKFVGEGENQTTIPGKLKVFINPKLSNPSSQLITLEEGCLSIPGIYEAVERPLSISVEAYDQDGNIFKEDFTGWEARAIMHENDHINGVLFIDRIFGKKKQALEPRLKQVKAKFQRK